MSKKSNIEGTKAALAKLKLASGSEDEENEDEIDSNDEDEDDDIDINYAPKSVLRRVTGLKKSQVSI